MPAYLHDDLRNASANGAMIASEMRSIRGQMENLTQAATTLAMIEAGTFEWELQKNDWESVCALIAQFLESRQRAPDRETILAAIANPRLNPAQPA